MKSEISVSEPAASNREVRSFFSQFKALPCEPWGRITVVLKQSRRFFKPASPEKKPCIGDGGKPNSLDLREPWAPCNRLAEFGSRNLREHATLAVAARCA